MFNKILSIILVVTSIFIFSGCAVSEVKPNNSSNVDYKAILDNAKEIKIQEAAMSIGKLYRIYVDDKVVAKVSGKVIKGFEDTFTLSDENGNFLIKEQEIKRWGKLNRSAAIMDKNDKVVGYIGEITLTKLLSIGYTFHFFDKEKNQIGISDQINFSLFKENKFYDNDKNVDYDVKQQLAVTDTYILKVNDTSNIPLYHAILMVCVEDAIKDSEDD